MPDKNYRPCSYYTDMIEDFKKYFALCKEVREAGDDLGLTFPLDTKLWTKADVKQLATNFRGLGMFNSLTELAAASCELNEKGTAYTEVALCAQKVMTQLKPNCCKTWEDYYKMLSCVQKDTKEEREIIEGAHPEIYKKVPEFNPRKISPKKTGAIIDLHKGADLAYEAPMLDHQIMLSKLDAKLHPSVTGEQKPVVFEEHINAALTKLKSAGKEQQQIRAA